MTMILLWAVGGMCKFMSRLSSEWGRRWRRSIITILCLLSEMELPTSCNVSDGGNLTSLDRNLIFIKSICHMCRYSKIAFSKCYIFGFSKTLKSISIKLKHPLSFHWLKWFEEILGSLEGNLDLRFIKDRSHKSRKRNFKISELISNGLLW